MDKDRVEGAAKAFSGKVVVAVGKAVGDEKTIAAGREQIVEGKVQNAVGSFKDVLRESLKTKS